MNTGEHICILIRTCTRTYAYAHALTFISSGHLTLDITRFTHLQLTIDTLHLALCRLHLHVHVH